MNAPSPLAAQNFDTYQRLATIAAVCERLVAHGCRTAVDVGGHPGVLADNLPHGLRCLAVIDLPVCLRPDAVRGDALALPLRTGSADVALCSDTLEHVGDPLRATRELIRVARRAVVITAPWKSEATDRVEAMLDRWHRQLTGMAHPWIAEHRENGLPDRRAVVDVFEAAGWKTVELACGTLAEWTLLQVGLLVHDLLPTRHLHLAEFCRDYNAHWHVRLTRRLPAQPYRTVLVGAAETDTLAGLADEEDAPPAAPPLTEALPLIDSLLTALQEALADAATSAPFETAYRERLEALTSQQAAEIEALRAEIARLGRGSKLIARARRAVNRLAGRRG